MDLLKGVKNPAERLVPLVALSLGSQLATRRLGVTPLAHSIIVDIVEVSGSHGDDVLEVVLVLGLDIGDGEAGGGLLANHGTKASLALHNAVRDTTGLAERREPHNDLDRVTSCAITTSLAFFSSTSEVTW